MSTSESSGQASAAHAGHEASTDKRVGRRVSALRRIDSQAFDSSGAHTIDDATLLILAAKRGDEQQVESLVHAGVSANCSNASKITPLHAAALANHPAVINLLLLHHANVNAVDAKRETPLHKVVQTHKSRECIFLLVSHGADLWAKNAESQRCIDFLLAHKYPDEFWIDIVAYDAVGMVLATMKSPVLLVNRLFKQSRDGSSLIDNYFRQRLRNQNPTVLRKLIMWYVSLSKAADRHINQQEDLHAFAGRFGQAVRSIFHCDSMDEPWNVQRILQPNRRLAMSEPILKHQMLSLQAGGLLDLCLLHECKFVFAISHVAGFVDSLFWASSRLEFSRYRQEEYTPPQYDRGGMRGVDLFVRCMRINVMDNPTVRRSYGVRSCPAARCLSEALFRATTLACIAVVSTVQYGGNCGTDYSPDACTMHRLSYTEDLLLLFLLGAGAQEVGLLIDMNFDVVKYFSDAWVLCDLLGLLLQVLWLVERDSSIAGARILLSLAAIPVSLGLLKYLVVWKELGVMVSMVRAMLGDMASFALVYAAFVVGFSIFFQGTFYGTSGYDGALDTLMTLFQSTLGAFDFHGFDTGSSLVDALGEGMLAVYLVITTVLLLNLLIARMTNAYARIDDNASEEWAHGKTRMVQRLLIFREKHAFCVLPPPFNLLTAALYPLHRWYLTDGWSLCGSLANVLYHHLAAPARAVALAVTFWPAIRGVLFTVVADTRPSAQSWAYALLYCASNLAALVLLLLFLLLVALCPAAADALYEPLPKLSFCLERMVGEVPQYLVVAPPAGEADEQHAVVNKEGVELCAVNPMVPPVRDAPAPDAPHIHEHDEPLYDEEDARRILQCLSALEPGEAERDADREELRQLRVEVSELRQELRSVVELLSRP